MSGLVEKVKDVVRSRSKHRQTNSTVSAGARDSSDQYVLAPEDAQAQSSTQENRRGRALREQSGVGGATTDLAALRLNDQVSATTKTKSGNTITSNHPPLPSNATQNIDSARAQNGASNGDYQQRRPLSGNLTTPRTPNYQRNFSGSNAGLDAQNVSPEIVPDRNSSMRRKPLPLTRIGTNPPVLNSIPDDRDGVNHPAGLRTSSGHRRTLSTDVAPDDPSPLVPHFTTRSSASPTSLTSPTSNGGADDSQRKDLRLPASFDLSNTERTVVDTTIRPAITSENVHIHRTEILTKAVHKDIHIDHHYTYIQPIPIREVLPARHFRLNPTTGIKTEIAAPAGYKLPAHLEPHEAEDYSHLRQTTRHYVVDNDYPNGLLEGPPLRHKEDISNMQVG